MKKVINLDHVFLRAHVTASELEARAKVMRQFQEEIALLNVPAMTAEKAKEAVETAKLKLRGSILTLNMQDLRAIDYGLELALEEVEE